MIKKAILFVFYLGFWIVVIFGSYWYFVDRSLFNFFSPKLKQVNNKKLAITASLPKNPDSILATFRTVAELSQVKIKFMKEEIVGESFMLPATY